MRKFIVRKQESRDEEARDELDEQEVHKIAQEIKQMKPNETSGAPPLLKAESRQMLRQSMRELQMLH